VLANDTDADGDNLTAVLVSGPSHGTLTLNADGSFNYTPDANFNGSDSFSYKANEGVADSNVVTVSITVNAENDPPVITSDGGGDTATLSVAENSTAVTTVTAIDPDSGANLVFSISGGADAGLFSIDAATGALRFLTAPDFEAPRDANADNVYEVRVQASDGSLVDTQTLYVNVTDVADQSPVYIGQGCCDSTALVVQGTEGADKVRIIPQGGGGSGKVMVVLNGHEYTFAAGSFTSIVVFGKGGDDDIELAGAIKTRACLFLLSDWSCVSVSFELL
jgi:VCBS repeat-containing protein